MSRRVGLWFAASLIGGTAVAVALWQIRSDDDTVSPSNDQSLQSAPDQPVASDVGDVSNGSPEQTSASDQGGFFNDLGYHCPTVKEELTDDCLQALNHRFWDDPVHEAPLVPVCDRPTFGEIFRDPAGKREIVARALTREECRASSNEIRVDTDCPRTEIAELGALFLECTVWNDYRIGTWFYSPILSELVDDIAFESTDEYEDSRRHVEAGYYRERWVAAKCESIDERVFAPIEELEGIDREIPAFATQHWVIGTDPAIFETVETPDWVIDPVSRKRYQGFRLTAAAARLGHRWALSQSPKFVDHTTLFTLNPAQALVNRADFQEKRPPQPREQREESQLREDMWERLEEIDPGIGQRYKETGWADLFENQFTSNARHMWWDSQEPSVEEVHAEFVRESIRLGMTHAIEREFSQRQLFPRRCCTCRGRMFSTMRRPFQPGLLMLQKKN